MSRQGSAGCYNQGMPNIIGRAPKWWEQGPFVVAVEGEPVGRCRRVLGLDQPFESGGRRDFQDVLVSGMDADLAEWTSARTGTVAVDFTVVDVRKKQWFKIQGAFVQRAGDTVVWTVSNIEPSEPPVR